MAKNTSDGDRPPPTMTPNQVAAWNLRRLRTQAGMTQWRLAELMSHFGIPWTVFTVSDAELAVRRGDKGRSFTLDELALLALVFYVTPAGLLTPPAPADTGTAQPVTMAVGDIEMSRETYLIDVLLHPSGVGARRVDGALHEQPARAR